MKLPDISGWFRSTFSETGGAWSLVRFCLFLVVGAVIAWVGYIIVQHFLHGVIPDLGPNTANVISVSVGSLSGAKAIQKFGEAPAA